jgi:DNA-directed RNA polymerase I subunit RPA2
MLPLTTPPTRQQERLFQNLLTAGRVLTKALLKDDDVSSDKFQATLKSCYNPISNGVKNFLATGNFSPRFCSDLQQTNGFVVMAEKLNMLRFTAHFRAVHRGAYFAEMKTTTVRKLLPDSWGFMCPVHTPDGAPCGLLNHLTAACQVVDGGLAARSQYSPAKLAAHLESLGMFPIKRTPSRASQLLTVLLDGAVVGVIPSRLVQSFELQLRGLKCGNNSLLPSHAEIVVVPLNYTFAYGAVYIFTGPSRLVRPVMSLHYGLTEWIGTFEQPFLDIAVRSEEATAATQYVELSRTQMLSLVASLTPFSDFNQSPRNMYQCQMGKQTMGVPATNLKVCMCVCAPLLFDSQHCAHSSFGQTTSCTD